MSLPKAFFSPIVVGKSSKEGALLLVVPVESVRSFLNPSHSDPSLYRFLMARDEEENCLDLLAVLQTRASQTVNYVLCKGEI